MKALLVLVIGMCFAGCGPALIPYSDVPDTAENREVIAFVDEYRVAAIERRPEAILRLVSPRYFDDNGTPNSDDDYDYDRLVENFARFSQEVLEVRYDMRFRRVIFREDRIFVDFAYIGNFEVRDVEGQRWERRQYEHRIELVREDGEYRILSGL